jgi:hypothetical protein
MLYAQSQQNRGFARIVISRVAMGASGRWCAFSATPACRERKHIHRSVYSRFCMYASGRWSVGGSRHHRLAHALRASQTARGWRLPSLVSLASTAGKTPAGEPRCVASRPAALPLSLRRRPKTPAGEPRCVAKSVAKSVARSSPAGVRERARVRRRICASARDLRLTDGPWLAFGVGGVMASGGAMEAMGGACPQPKVTRRAAHRSVAPCALAVIRSTPPRSGPQLPAATRRSEGLMRLTLRRRPGLMPGRVSTSCCVCASPPSTSRAQAVPRHRCVTLIPGSSPGAQARCASQAVVERSNTDWREREPECQPWRAHR